MVEEQVVRPSLLRGVDIEKLVPMDLQIGWEELLDLAVNPTITSIRS